MKCSRKIYLINQFRGVFGRALHELEPPSLSLFEITAAI
jgi:hypothetical protein